MSSITLGNCLVKSNKEDRTWETHYGNLVASFFVAGNEQLHKSEAKWKAVQIAVAMTDPKTYILIRKAVQKRPYLKFRAWRAAILVANGHVKNHDGVLDRGIANVVSQRNESKEYTVHWKPDLGLACTCKDFTSGRAPFLYIDEERQPICKHIIATQTAIQLGRFKTPQEAIA